MSLVNIQITSLHIEFIAILIYIPYLTVNHVSWFIDTRQYISQIFFGYLFFLMNIHRKTHNRV